MQAPRSSEMKTLTRYTSRFDALVEFFPSVAWLGLMLLPLAFQYSTLHPVTRGFQLATVAAIAVFFFLADYLSFRKAVKSPCLLEGGLVSVRNWLFLVGLCFLLPALSHLYLMPEIPLVAAVTDWSTTQDSLRLLRHSSAKLLDLPPLVKYFFNWSLTVFAPLFIVVAFVTGKHLYAVLALLFAGLYAGATLAKLPLLLLLVTCFTAMCVMPTRFRRILSAGWVAAVLVGASLVAVFSLSGSVGFMAKDPSLVKSLEFPGMKADDPRLALTHGDIRRLTPEAADASHSGMQNAAEYIFYRAWLTPSDVSSRWYQYFTYVQKEPLGLAGFLPFGREGAVVPSRAVGIWAYQERFPHRYLQTISAYASFDADAFARGGGAGVALATLILLATRLTARFLVAAHPVSLAAYGVLLCAFAILPSSASLQAVLGAQGMFIPLVILLIIRLLALKT